MGFPKQAVLRAALKCRDLYEETDHHKSLLENMYLDCTRKITLVKVDILDVTMLIVNRRP